MSLNIDQIRQYDRGGSLAISNAPGNGPAQIEKTGFFHWLGCLFGVEKTIAKNEQTIAALRTAIQNDPRYFAQNVQFAHDARRIMDGLLPRQLEPSAARHVNMT